RYPEIIRLNRSVIGPDNEITPGTILRLPADATGLAAHAATQEPAGHTDVRVQPGDTLWDIEQRVTGSGANWTAGWQANQDSGARVVGQPVRKPGRRWRAARRCRRGRLDGASAAEVPTAPPWPCRRVAARTAHAARAGAVRQRATCVGEDDVPGSGAAPPCRP